jgi:hypothetical protein
MIVLGRGERVDLCLFLVSGVPGKDQDLCDLWWRPKLNGCGDDSE